MYIKIKNPTRYTLLMQLGALVLVLAVILAIGIIFTFVSGSMSAVWEGTREFVRYIKQEEGVFTVVFCIFGLLMIPVGIIATFMEWKQKRTQWADPTNVFALDFGPEGVTAYRHQNTIFFPYQETDFKMTAELVTVRTKNSSHAALHALTLLFLSQGHRIKVSHKLTTLKCLYQLADLHAYFKSFSFACQLSSSYDVHQQELAAFLKEQMQNQIRYGLHRRYRAYFTMILGSLLFLAFGMGSLCLVFSFGFKDSFRISMSGMFLLLAIGFLTSGTILLYRVIQDKHIERKLKQLRGN